MLPANERFELHDQSLTTSTGPHWLNIPAVAECVISTLHYGAEQICLYDLRAWVIMSNHVHILIDPRAPLAKITKSIKNYSAKEANRILQRTGQPFWQNESYDRVVRNEKEHNDIVRYIEFNPVNAGLVATPEQYRWSSAWVGQEAYPTEQHT